jgi:anti-sigma B factor antagonist
LYWIGISGKSALNPPHGERGGIRETRKEYTMKSKTKDLKGVTIIELKGNVMGGPDATMLNNELHNLIESGKTKVVIDLGDVKFMNSSGLGMLIGGLTTMRNAGGDLKIARASEKIESLLIVTKLITVFDHHETVEKAIKAFG